MKHTFTIRRKRGGVWHVILNDEHEFAYCGDRLGIGYETHAGVDLGSLRNLAMSDRTCRNCWKKAIEDYGHKESRRRS